MKKKNGAVFQSRMAVLSLLLLLGFRANGQKESFPNYFTFYNPANVNVPQGSDTAGKAILTYTRITGQATVNTGTIFLINTFRDDDTICACLSGHQMPTFYPNDHVIPGPFSGNTDIYMNYRGKDTILSIGGTLYTHTWTTGYSKGTITGGELVAFYYDSLNNFGNPDIALVLLDKRQLPISSYATLGYDFSPSNWGGSLYYSINHPHFYPQRLQDNFTFNSQAASMVTFTTSLPFAMGQGSSGGPLVRKPSAPADPWYVRGVVSQMDGTTAGMVWDRITGKELDYGTHISFTRIATIESEIKRHCWKNRDSNEILSSGIYRRSVLINNAANITQFSQKRAISSTNDITAAASSGPVKKRILSSYVPGDQCDLGSFTLPATYPGSTNFWQVTIAAKEINVGGNFSYDPADQSELNLSSVVLNGGTASSPLRRTDTTTPSYTLDKEYASSPKVYPNPSPDGIFNIVLPDTGQYSVAVYSMEGKEIYRTNCTVHPFRLELPQIARGTYLLHVYRAGLTVPAFKTLIVY